MGYPNDLYNLVKYIEICVFKRFDHIFESEPGRAVYIRRYRELKTSFIMVWLVLNEILMGI